MKSLFLFLMLNLNFISTQNCFSQTVTEKDTPPMLFKNGKIITMNGDNTFEASMLIDRGKIIAFGNDALKKSIGAVVIDLKGKTVVPGLIDSHIHFIRQAQMPGHLLTEAENVGDTKSLLKLLSDAGMNCTHKEWISVIGGITMDQFAEKRLPDEAELNSILTDNPVFLEIGFDGPCQVNSAARKILINQKVVIGPTGAIAKGKETVKAFKVLKALQTPDEKLANTIELVKYANSTGLTTVIDEGGTSFIGAAYFNPYDDYNYITDLWRKKKLTLRIRIQNYSQDSTAAKGVLEERLHFGWDFFGDDMMRITGTGEHLVTFPQNGVINPAYFEKASLVSKAGFSNEQHSCSVQENEQHLSIIEKVNSIYPIAGKRWSLAHVFELGMPGTEQLVARIKALNLGLRVEDQGYISRTDIFPLGRTLKGPNSGPYFRTLYDDGFILGAGTDGPLLGPMNPWLSIYYMVTGKDVTGKVVNPGQVLTRIEALKLYTMGSAWFSFDEQKLGSLEIGKMADFVVLNADYLFVPNESLKKIRAVLTVVDGRIVYEKKAD